MISKPKPARIYKLLDKSYIFIFLSPFSSCASKTPITFYNEWIFLIEVWNSPYRWNDF